MFVYFRSMRPKDENKRIAIYHAAMEIINSDGLANVSMSKIAKAAGVSSSTIYVYFENKEDMLNKLYLMATEEASATFYQEFTENMEVKAGLASFMRKFFIYMKAHPVKFSFIEQFFYSPNIRLETIETGHTYYEPLIELFVRGVQQKIIKDYPLQLIRAFTFAPIMGLVRYHHNQELDVNEDMLERAIEMAWRAVKV